MASTDYFTELLGFETDVNYGSLVKETKYKGKRPIAINKGNDAVLKDNAKVAPVNLTLHALFRDVILKANGIIITQ
uniref:Uncharacterized protein n=1 Tax=Romanomermis culicivorax TaxID=13658 RepID=A0A915HGQ1_ROMCU